MTTTSVRVGGALCAVAIGALAAAGPGGARAASVAVIIFCGSHAVRRGHRFRAACAGMCGIAIVAATVPGSAVAVAWGLALALAALLGVTLTGWERTASRAAADIDSLLLARSSDSPAVAAARTIIDLLDGAGGRVVWTVDGDDALANQAMNSGDIIGRRRRSVAVPLVGARGTTAVVVVRGAQRRLTPHLRGVLMSIGRAAAEELDDLRLRSSLLSDALVDPVTGLANSSGGMAALAAAAEGDVILLVGFSDWATLLSVEGTDRRELLACQLGLHLRNRLRASDVVARMDNATYLAVLRGKDAEMEKIVSRLVGSWGSEDGPRRVVSAAVRRSRDVAPVDELAAVRDALRIVGSRPSEPSPFAPVRTIRPAPAR